MPLLGTSGKPRKVHLTPTAAEFIGAVLDLLASRAYSPQDRFLTMRDLSIQLFSVIRQQSGPPRPCGDTHLHPSPGFPLQSPGLAEESQHPKQGLLGQETPFLPAFGYLSPVRERESVFAGIPFAPTPLPRTLVTDAA